MKGKDRTVPETRIQALPRAVAGASWPASPDVRQRVTGTFATFPFHARLRTFRGRFARLHSTPEVRRMQNRPVVLALAFLLLFVALAFWRSCSY